jgi:hypothetical protein
MVSYLLPKDGWMDSCLASLHWIELEEANPCLHLAVLSQDESVSLVYGCRQTVHLGVNRPIYQG